MSVPEKNKEWWDPNWSSGAKWEDVVEKDGKKVVCRSLYLGDALDHHKVLQKLGSRLLQEIRTSYEGYISGGGTKEGFLQHKFSVLVWARCAPPRQKEKRLDWIHHFIGWSDMAKGMRNLTSVEDVLCKVSSFGFNEARVVTGTEKPFPYVYVYLCLNTDQIFEIALMPAVYKVV